MFELRFEVNGRGIQPGQIKSALEQAVLAKVQAHVTGAAGTTRCPDHGQYARITARGRTVEQLEFHISGCCDKLINSVRRKLNAK